jgi:3'-5' exoribonuclease-like protein
VKYFYDTEFIENGKTIDLISIGIVAEDGREYYAISSEFDESKASPWVQENVLFQLPTTKTVWKSRASIANEVRAFITEESRDVVELWADYCAYDHVVLCQLYGTMMELPPNIPMFTNDFQQLWRKRGCPSLPVQKYGLHDALADARHLRDTLTFLVKIMDESHGQACDMCRKRYGAIEYELNHACANEHMITSGQGIWDPVPGVSISAMEAVLARHPMESK